MRLATAWLLSVGLGCASPGPEPCDPAAVAPLTAPARFVIGEGVPYDDDPTLFARVEELHASQRARREVGWAIAERGVRPVVVTGAAEAREVPLFQTWYDGEDLHRLRMHLRETRDPTDDSPYTDAEIDEAFAWNTTAVREHEAWPPDRLAAFVAAIDSDERARGAGGVERVLFSPRAARHLLKSAAQIEACGASGAPAPDVTSPDAPGTRAERVELTACGARTLGPYHVAPGGAFVAEVDGDVRLEMVGVPSGACTSAGCEAVGPADVELVARPTTAAAGVVDVTWDERAAPYVPCLDGGFPAGAVIAKADYRRVGFGVLVPVFDTSAAGLRARFAADGDWGDGGELADPGPDSILTLELPNANRYRMVALHLMTKELDHWTWMTLWWSPDADLDFGADRPAALGVAPWSSYKMCIATEFTERDPDPTGGVDDATLGAALQAVHEGVGGPSWCSNPYLERGPGNAVTNCVGCHQHAGTDLTTEQILAPADRGRLLRRANFPTDYTFAFTLGE